MRSWHSIQFVFALGLILVALVLIIRSGGPRGAEGNASASERRSSRHAETSGSETGCERSRKSGPRRLPRIQSVDNGRYFLRDAPLNSVFRFLADQAGKQYFHNEALVGGDYVANGFLDGDDMLQDLETLSALHDLIVCEKGNSIYALNSEQAKQLPAKELSYRFRNIRPTNHKQITNLIDMCKVDLSDSGIVEFDPKENTIVIIDRWHHLNKAEKYLARIDVGPNPQ